MTSSPFSPPAMAWTALKGAAKYAAAVAKGDKADSATRRKRAVTCARCPSARDYNAPLLGLRVTTCGWAGQDRLTDPYMPTCGCLVAIETRGLGQAVRVAGSVRTPVRAAGKAWVGTEECPQGKW